MIKYKRIACPIYFYTFGPHPAVVCVATGAALTLGCPDSDNYQSDGTPLPFSRRQPPAVGGSALFPGNPLAGPIAVDRAAPGDALAVTINAVRLDRDTGRTLLAPGHGLLSSDQLTGRRGDAPERMLHWAIDVGNSRARLTNAFGTDTVEVSLNPFVGCVGVCPPRGEVISSLFAGDFGGNMDLPFLRPGTTVILPVFAPGGLFMLGDIHAAQGHGEIIGGGIETSGEVDFTLSLLRDDGLSFPRAIDGENVYAIASHGDLRQAVGLACTRLIDWLAAEFEMNRFDAYALMTHTVSIITGNAVTAPYTVAAAVPRGVLPARVKSLLDHR